MPEAPKVKSKRKSPHAWTTGGKRSIAHVEPIGSGAFGEVHKVCIAALDAQTNEGLDASTENRGGNDP